MLTILGTLFLRKIDCSWANILNLEGRVPSYTYFSSPTGTQTENSQPILNFDATGSLLTIESDYDTDTTYRIFDVIYTKIKFFTLTELSEITSNPTNKDKSLVFLIDVVNGLRNNKYDNFSLSWVLKRYFYYIRVHSEEKQDPLDIFNLPSDLANTTLLEPDKLLQRILLNAELSAGFMSFLNYLDQKNKSAFAFYQFKKNDLLSSAGLSSSVETIKSNVDLYYSVISSMIKKLNNVKDTFKDAEDSLSGDYNQTWVWVSPTKLGEIVETIRRPLPMITEGRA